MRDVCEATPIRPVPGTPSATSPATPTATFPGTSRRRVLAWCAAAAVLPPVLAACSAGSGIDSDDTKTLLALADQARADAALVVAAVTADPTLAERLEPLRAARIDHAAALDAAGGRTAASAVTPPAPDTADVVRVRDAVVSSARAAGAAVAQAPAAQVGLLGEIAACCTTYGVVLA